MLVFSIGECRIVRWTCTDSEWVGYLSRYLLIMILRVMLDVSTFIIIVFFDFFISFEINWELIYFIIYAGIL